MSQIAARRAAQLASHLCPTSASASASASSAGVAPAEVASSVFPQAERVVTALRSLHSDSAAAAAASSSSSSSSSSSASQSGASASAAAAASTVTSEDQSTGEGAEKLSMRAQARFAGLSGNHWFAMEQSANVKPGTMVEEVYWGTPICILRGRQGQVFAFGNECFDGTKLTDGHVDGDVIVSKSGLMFNLDGQAVNETHETHGYVQPSRSVRRLRVYPVRERYGLVFVFPGNPALANGVPLPTIPWLDRAEKTPFKMVDIALNAHWSLIMENNCDFYHAYLHRKFAPFTWPQLQWVQRRGDTVQVHYKTDMGKGQLASRFSSVNDELQAMHLWFDYPYQRSNLVDRYLHWCFMLPISERRTRTFYIFLWGPISVGGMQLPNWMRPPLLKLTHKFYLSPLLSQDVYALEEEQRRLELHYGKHAVELNPLVSAFQKLTLEKWNDYIATEKARRASVSEEEWALTAGAGHVTEP